MHMAPCVFKTSTTTNKQKQTNMAACAALTLNPYTYKLRLTRYRTWFIAICVNMRSYI